MISYLGADASINVYVPSSFPKTEISLASDLDCLVKPIDRRPTIP